MAVISIFYGYVFNRDVFDQIIKRHIKYFDELVNYTTYETAVSELFSTFIGVSTSYDFIKHKDNDLQPKVYIYLKHTGIDIQPQSTNRTPNYKILDSERFEIRMDELKILNTQLAELGLITKSIDNGWVLANSRIY